MSEMARFESRGQESASTAGLFRRRNRYVHEALAKLRSKSSPPIPANEPERLARLYEYAILDTLPERDFDDLTALAAAICGTPIALISLIDDDRQWFKSRVGIEATETSREVSFCAHAINENNLLLVPDALDDQRFSDNPNVVGDPHIRFYAGTPLRTPDGFALGTICVADRVPRDLTPEQLRALEALGRQVVTQLELRRHAHELEKLNRQLGLEISERRRTEASLIESHERYRHVIEHATEIIYAVDRSGVITFANPSMHLLLGLAPGSLPGVEHTTLLRSDFRDFARNAYERQRVSRSRISELELPFVAADGSEIWLAQSVALVDKQGRGGGFQVVARDVTRQRTHDPLTALPNRGSAEQLIQRLLERASSNEGVGVLMVAPDRLKRFSDSYGHSFAESLLREFADRLVAAAGEHWTVARAGEEEFVVVVPFEGSGEALVEIAQRLLSTFRAPARVEEQDVYVSASIGVALTRDHSSRASTLLQHAASTLFRAKQHGGNKFEIFSEDIDRRAQHLFSLEASVRRALDREDLLLFFQPQTRVATGEVCGMEALLRWVSSDGTILPPAELIAIAEEHGLIAAVDRWVLRAALRQCATWREEGRALMPCAVNISAPSFQHPGFVEMVTEACREARIPPSFLHLELTESSLMREPALAVATLHALREIGVRTSIDDFGAGYSSLSYLRELPVDYLKIDRSLLRNVTESVRDAAIVKAIVSLAHNLAMEVVAEGVETPGQVNFLQEIGCDQSQGYFLSRPLSADDFRDRFLGRVE